MEMPSNCKCGEVVELHDMNTCDKCREMLCEECCEEPWGICENCKYDMAECSECGDWVDKDEIGKKGRCTMCNETMFN